MDDSITKIDSSRRFRFFSFSSCPSMVVGQFTSYVERQNLTMRMSMRRFTRLTNAFSKKVENLAHAVALHFMSYNFVKPHGTLTKQAEGTPTTPAMAAGVATAAWSYGDIIDLLGSN